MSSHRSTEFNQNWNVQASISSMNNDDTLTRKRLHIGNISAKLAESPSMLETRLRKFGEILTPLEFHTKPTNDFYFAFVDIKTNKTNFDKLKASLNGIMFMGRKVTLDEAKMSFDKVWAKDSGRPPISKKELDRKAGIALTRDKRILESTTSTPRNTLDMTTIRKTCIIGANNSSIGYSKSAHTFQNASGNTKNKSPSHTLLGTRSYGSSIVPKGPMYQQISRTSGNGEVIKGRMRKTARSTTYFARKQQTMRILINGELKQIKCYKTKLWGVEKNKSTRDLTYKFEDGVWKSGDDHIVERISPRHSSHSKIPQVLVSCGIDGKEAEEYGKGNLHRHELERGLNEESKSFEEEQNRNVAVLAKLFNSEEFEKKTRFEEESSENEDVQYDSKGRKIAKSFDFETQGVVEFSDSDTDDHNTNSTTIIEEFKAYGDRPPQEIYYSEDDEGNNLGMDLVHTSYTSEAIKDQYDKEHANSDMSLDATEEIDSSEIQPDIEHTDANDIENDKNSTKHNSSHTAPGNPTETLRSLFVRDTKGEDSNTFSFAIQDDDIDEQNELVGSEERNELLEQIKAKQKQESENIESKQISQRKFGLFWGHFESPFLQSQTQLSKIGYVGETVILPDEDEKKDVHVVEGEEEDDYEKWFWSMRGEVGRECKRRKRDVMRMIKKKSTKAYV